MFILVSTALAVQEIIDQACSVSLSSSPVLLLRASVADPFREHDVQAQVMRRGRVV